jgi:hypothetical protein
LSEGDAAVERQCRCGDAGQQKLLLGHFHL